MHQLLLYLIYPQPAVSTNTPVIVTFLNSSNIDHVKLRHMIDQLETIAGIQQGFEELNAGQTRSLENFIEEMQQNYGISG